MNNKRTAEQFGRRAETLAAWSLRLKGYRILARGFRTPVGDIDIIARRGRLVVFIEVKARRSLDIAAGSIGRRQTDRIIRAASAFMQGRPQLEKFDQRFDAVLVAPWRWPVHLVDAWRPTT